MKINLGTIQIRKKLNLGNVRMGIKKLYPALEPLTVTPSGEKQVFKPKSYGFNPVEVEGVESEELNVMPSAEEQVAEGLFKKVTVSGEANLIPENIKRGTKVFEIEGTMDAAWDTSQTRRWYQSFYGNTEMTEFPDIDFSNTENIYQMCYGCTGLIKAKLRNTSGIRQWTQAFNGCTRLTTVEEVDASNAWYVQQMFNSCTKLINVGGFKNMGKGFSNQSTNASFHKVSFTSAYDLTHESLINIIKGLYDLNLTYDVAGRRNFI